MFYANGKWLICILIAINCKRAIHYNKRAIHYNVLDKLSRTATNVWDGWKRTKLNIAPSRGSTAVQSSS